MWNVGVKCGICGQEISYLEDVKTFKIDRRKSLSCGHKIGQSKIESIWI